MKIAFDLKNLWLYGKGIGAFTVNLLSDLANYQDQNDIYIQLYSPSFDIEGISFINKHERFCKVTTPNFNRESRISKLKYDQYVLLQFLKKNKPDLLFSPYFDMPLLWNKPVITTIHDLSIFERKDSYSKAFFLYYKKLIQKAIAKSSFIVTVSEYSRKKLVEECKISENRIRVIYNRAPASFIQSGGKINSGKLAEVKAKYSLPEEFVLYTGGVESRKRIDLLIRGMENARKYNPTIPKLIITGVSPNLMADSHYGILNSKHVIVLDFLPYQDMVSLYQLASLVVNTSCYEGFGMPVLEAITMKKPMLCSDIPVYKEIGDDCVYYFKNNDQKSFEENLMLYFKGKLPSLCTGNMVARSNFFNNKNYAELFFHMVKQSV